MFASTQLPAQVHTSDRQLACSGKKWSFCLFRLRAPPCGHERVPAFDPATLQMRDREQRIAELKKRCRELEAALEALAYSATVSPSNGAGVLETGDHSLPDTAARQGSAGTDGREHRGASTCPTRPAGATASSSIAVRELD
eukprot:scaffold113492_cov19-Tisochrysis_lutea.AAC.1